MSTSAAAHAVACLFAPRRPLVAIGLASLLAACAPLRSDPGLDTDRDLAAATAPELPGFGQVGLVITSRSPVAQHWFEQGMQQAYAFNDREAVRAFKAALAQDATCAMCAWGVAWQLGPNINDTSRDKVPEALRFVDRARRHADGATPRERALIDAMALRYAHASQVRDAAPMLADICRSPGSDQDQPDPLDVAYAERLRTLADADPDDPDIVSLYAEAEMIATRGDWWNRRTGQPAGRIGEVAERLERALPRHTQHTGVNHYLIHAVDAPGVAQRAVAAADRLGRLAPNAPHLLHMPSHTYVRMGRYADAVRVNEAALAADVTLAEAQKTQGFDVSNDWRGHNGRFLWFSALMTGQGDLALTTARQAAERAAKADHVFGEYVRALPMLTLLRLERWDGVLQEPAPTGTHGVATVLAEQSRGVAFARTGRVAEAQASLAGLQAAARPALAALKGPPDEDKMPRDLIAMARSRLQAEIALAEARHDDALRFQREALEASIRLDDSEPPMLADGARLVLAGMMQRAGRATDAEAVYRLDLAAQPGSGWALRGLSEVLASQGRSAEAATLRAELDRSWAQADTGLRVVR